LEGPAIWQFHGCYKRTLGPIWDLIGGTN